MISGGELLTRLIDAQDVRTVFALAGASHTYLLDPLDRAGFAIVSSRHESGAVGSADGYARVTGRPGFALIVADQGLPNAIGALAVSWHACTPVVVLVATSPRLFVETDVAIDQDKLALVTPITKWARTVPDVARLEDYMHAALRHATTGRPGPVVLLIPEHVLSDQVAPPSLPALPTPSSPEPSADAIERAARCLGDAERPIVIAGAGAAWGDAGAPLAALNQRFGLPLFANGLGRGMVAEDDHSVLSWPFAQIAAHRADCVLLVGARLTQRLGLGLPPRFSADARFIQIDIEASAFHRNRDAAVAIHADAGPALSALVDRLEATGFSGVDSGWLDDALMARRARIAELADSAAPAIHPLHLGASIMRRLPQNAVYVGDGADVQTWMYGAIRIRRPRGFLDHYPMGAMGSGTALAVGAAAALRESDGVDAPPVVLVTGDGAFGFHATELHAAVRAGLNLIVVVGNDGAWGTEAHGQQATLGRRINTELGALPYHRLAKGLGAEGLLVTDKDALPRALDEAFASNGTVLVNVHIDPDAGAELKQNADVRMILFSDILEGQADLRRFGADE